MAETVAARAQRTLDVWDAGADVRYERWRAMVRELLAALAAAEAERDQVAREIVSLADATLRIATVLNVASEIMDDPAATWTILGQRATRLAALEAAVWAWAADMPIETGEAGLRLLAVVAGLAVPPGEGA